MIELVCASCGRTGTPASTPRSQPARCPTCSGLMIVNTGSAPAQPSHPESSLVGTSFGKYAVSAEIGRGSMGVVYDAQDTLLHRRVALKIMHGARGGEPREAVNEWQRFMQEARLTANVAKHPNIVTVYEAAVHDSRRFIAMEYVAGESMSRWRQGRSSREQLRLLRDVAIAVHHAHEYGIIHRDLKPGNVLVAKGGVPVVTDFGLATYERKGPTHSLTPSGFCVGSPAYMSPEQARGQKDVGRTTDVYAIGIMIYEAIAGHPPFEGKNPVETLSRVVEGTRIPPSQAAPLPQGDPTLDQICMKAMARQASERYATCAELAAALTQWLEKGRPGKPAALSAGQIATFAVLCSLLAGILVWNKHQSDMREAEHREEIAVTLREIERLKAPPPTPPPPQATAPAASIVLKNADFTPDGSHAGNHVTNSRIVFEGPGQADATVTLPETADYEIIVTASCDQARNEFAKYRLYLDGKKLADVPLRSEKPEDYATTTKISAGERRLGIRFLNDFWVAKPREDRNLYVHAVMFRKAR